MLPPGCAASSGDAPLRPRRPTSDHPAPLDRSPIDRHSQLLSLDVFGVGLARLVVDPGDVHRLVARQLGRHLPALSAVYAGIRTEAERRAREAAAWADRGAVSLADIADQLPSLLEPVVAHPERVARAAVAREVTLEQRLSRARPEALRLVAEARRRRIRCAFVADTYLPRDLVAQMLRAAGLPADLVLVSSHEGMTKTDGRLFVQLAQRAGLRPDRITHIGPDRVTDLEAPARVGLRGAVLPLDGPPGRSPLALGFRPPTALDSIALALAHQAPGSGLARLGYRAGGPLAAGFAAWAAQLVDRQRPDHVFLAGPGATLLRDVLLTLRPDLASAPIRTVPTNGRRGELEAQLTRVAAETGVRGRDRVLVADLSLGAGTTGEVRRWQHDHARPVEVTVARVGALDPADHHQGARLWACTGLPGDQATRLARRRPEVLAALLALPHPVTGDPFPVPAEDPDPAEVGSTGGDRADRDRAAGATGPAGATGAEANQPGGAGPDPRVDGVLRFAADLRPWLATDPHHTTPVLAEPALRLVDRADPADAAVLDRLLPEPEEAADPPAPARVRPRRVPRRPLAAPPLLRSGPVPLSRRRRRSTDR